MSFVWDETVGGCSGVLIRDRASVVLLGLREVVGCEGGLPSSSGGMNGSLVIGAWCSLMYNGGNNLQQNAETVEEASKRLAHGISQIPELFLLSEKPVGS